jgi:hypothetical protein
MEYQKQKDKRPCSGLNGIDSRMSYQLDIGDGIVGRDARGRWIHLNMETM